MAPAVGDGSERSRHGQRPLHGLVSISVKLRLSMQEFIASREQAVSEDCTKIDGV